MVSSKQEKIGEEINDRQQTFISELHFVIV
jgi:hypothetical protein